RSIRAFDPEHACEAGKNLRRYPGQERQNPSGPRIACFTGPTARGKAARVRGPPSQLRRTQSAMERGERLRRLVRPRIEQRAAQHDCELLRLRSRLRAAVAIERRGFGEVLRRRRAPGEDVKGGTASTVAGAGKGKLRRRESR